MAIFYTRAEDNSEIILVYKYRAAYYWLMAIAFLSIFVIRNFVEGNFWLDFLFTFGVTGIFLIFCLVYFIDFWPVDRAVRAAMKKGMVTVSGNKFSFSNPIKVIIKKT